MAAVNQGDTVSDFKLEPFEFKGQHIEFSAGADDPHSRVFAAIAARGTMLDPDVAADIERDHGPEGDYQAVFLSIVSEYQQAYLMGGQSPDWFFGQVRTYHEAYPTEGLLEMVEFASANRPVPMGMPFSMGGDLGPAARRSGARAVDKDKAKKKQKAAHKARMKNKR